MRERAILFFDSGVGGLPYLEYAKEKLQNESYVYVCDSENFPYGNKDSKDLVQVILQQMEKIIHRFSPKIGVIACNTASVIALSELRQAFDIPFIGVVPAIKPAVEKVNGKRIAIIATKRTTEEEYLKALIQDFASKNFVLKVAANQLVDLVENDFFDLNPDQRIKKIDFFIKQIVDEKIDTIVLGCTHFILLKNDFQKLLGPKMKIIDSRGGVISQLQRVLEKKKLLSRSLNHTNELWLTKEIDQNRYKAFADKYKLDYKGEIL